MRKIDVDPSEIGVWARYPALIYHNEPLEVVVRREGWGNIPRVPIFELPKGHRHGYVLIDGHSRHEAAVKTNSLLLCNLYEPDEPIDIIKDKLAPLGWREETVKKDEFLPTLRLYLRYEFLNIIQNLPRTRC